MDAPIVVGMDGSAGARTALEYAVGDAARRGARVRAVMAFEAPDYWPEFDTCTLLGSVGLHCVLHAPCRVTVVRPPRTAPVAGKLARTAGSAR